MTPPTTTPSSPPAICPVCNGSGICLSCGGVGTIYRPGPPMPWDPWPIDPECLTCKATGNCQHCNGTGAANSNQQPPTTTMNILSTHEALQIINAQLKRPISKQLFHQSILPLMLARGDARKLSVDTAIDGAWLPAWTSYLAWREAQIDAGALPPKHPYSISEMEEHFYGAHDE